MNEHDGFTSRTKGLHLVIFRDHQMDFLFNPQAFGISAHEHGEPMKMHQ